MYQLGTDSLWGICDGSGPGRHTGLGPGGGDTTAARGRAAAPAARRATAAASRRAAAAAARSSATTSVGCRRVDDAADVRGSDAGHAPRGAAAD